MNSLIAFWDEPALWIFAGILLIVALGRLSWRKSRLRAWKALARRLGFEHFDEDGHKLSGGVATEKEVTEVQSFDLECMRGGYDFQVLLGREGKERIFVTDYEEVRIRDVDSADGMSSVRREYPRTVCSRRTVKRKRPRILVWHESNYAESLRWFSSCRMLTFPDDPEFAAQFAVKSDDPVAAQRLLNGGLLDHIKSTAVPGFHLEMDADTVAIHFGRRCSPDEIRGTLEQLREVTELLAE